MKIAKKLIIKIPMQNQNKKLIYIFTKKEIDFIESMVREMK